MLGGENAGLKNDLKAQGDDFARHMADVKGQNDELAGQSKTLRRQLEELKKDSEGMVLATAMAARRAPEHARRVLAGEPHARLVQLQRHRPGAARCRAGSPRLLDRPASRARSDAPPQGQKPV